MICENYMKLKCQCPYTFLEAHPHCCVQAVRASVLQGAAQRFAIAVSAQCVASRTLPFHCVTLRSVFLLSAHASHAKARQKEKSGLGAFEAEWHVGYFVTKLDGKALCVLYQAL